MPHTHSNPSAPDPSSPNPSSHYDAAQFERPSVTADIVIFTVREKQLHILLVRRKEWPFAGLWALPGGFVRPNETPDDAARRELAEETGVRDVYLEQLRVFGEPHRDPRTWVITVAYTALISSDRTRLHAASDAADAQWFPLSSLPLPLAFDHAAILEHAAAHLRVRVQSQETVVKELLPAHFSLTQMQEVYEILLGSALDKRNFRKWALGTGAIAATGQEVRGQHRPALLYAFAPNTETTRTSLLFPS